MEFDWVVVGAGFTGATFAERLASQLDQRVLVIDSRNHIGGNAYDRPDRQGVLIHEYGPHIFHTNSETVWRYLSRFTRWRRYEHRVLAEVEDRLVPVPFNLTSLRALFPPGEAARLEERLVGSLGRDARVPVLRLLEHADPDIRRFGEYVYEQVFVGYTTKQWGLGPEQLDRSVTGRVPVVIGYDDRYFTDTYQAIPEAGYTSLISNMLDHPRITVALGVRYEDLGRVARRTVYTGPIDALLSFRYGELPYRSIRFENRTLTGPIIQPAATINYPNAHAFTRSTEHRWLTGQDSERTTICYEYPIAHVPGVTEPYYPVVREENRLLYERYAADVALLGDEIILAGRLADYRYYNMDQAVAMALQVFKRRVLPLVSTRPAA